jgi:predicted acylesterase/phospholipase RssA
MTPPVLTPADYAPPDRRRLRPQDVKYLVFEGGGGKGFAYLGALKALADRNVLRYSDPDSSQVAADGKRHSLIDFRYLRGFGGASAGAITAFLLSIGYTLDELATLMSQKDKFRAFFDGGYNDEKNPQTRRLMPVFGGGAYTPVQDTEDEKKQKDLLRLADSYLGLESYVVNFYKSIGLWGGFWFSDLVDIAIEALKKNKNVSPFDKVIPNWKDFLVNFARDWGLFAGYAARQLFDQLLSARMPPDNNGKPIPNIPFEAHYQYFHNELLVIGTNLLTGKMQVFSHVDTPWVPVADAVRISMGIPFCFKPVVIPITHPIVPVHPELRGCWVDGGLLNNTPFREFEDRPGANPKTLALRLEVEPWERDMESIKDFVGSYLKLALMGPGEAYITSAHAFQTVVLDTTGLSLLDFGPDDKAVQAAGKKAYKTMSSYFDGAGPSYGDFPNVAADRPHA